MSVGLEQVVGGAFAGVGGGSVGVVDVAEVVGEERVAADRTGTGRRADEELAQCGGVHPEGSQPIAGDALMIADLGRLRRTRQPPTDAATTAASATAIDKPDAGRRNDDMNYPLQAGVSPERARPWNSRSP